MKRTIALIVALLMCLGLFMGCSGDETASTDSTSAGTSDGIFSTEDVKFTNDGDNAYTIIRPAEDDNAAKKAAYLFKQIKEKIGVNIKVLSVALFFGINSVISKYLKPAN